MPCYQRRIRPPHRRHYDWHGLRRGEAPFVLLQHTLSGSGRSAVRESSHMEMRTGQTLLLSFPHDNRYWLPRARAGSFSGCA